jgi:hypothetical protein
MISFKQFLSERRMNQRGYASVFKRLGDDAKVGFEIEVLCPEGSDFWTAADDEPPSIEVNQLDTYAQFGEYFIINSPQAREIERDYADWLSEKQDQYVEQNWMDFDDDEAAGRRKAEKKAPRYDWSDWFAAAFKTGQRFIDAYELEAKYGWATNTAIFKSAPGNVNYMGGWKASAEVLRQHLSRELSEVVKVNAHGYAHWNITHDSSILDDDGSDYESGMKGYGFEIVSPPLPADEAIGTLEKLLRWLDKAEMRTNESTGLHVNISMPGLEKLDALKLVLFMGDKYVLEKFEREANTYTRSQLQTVIDGITDRGEIPKAAKDIIAFGQRALKETGKYYSVNLKFPAPKYLEFRAAGGAGYHKRFEDLKEVVGRWLTALEIACNPDMERKEYLKKVVKLLELIPMAKEKKQNQELTYLMVLKKDYRMLYDQVQNAEPGSADALVAARAVLIDLGQRLDDERIELKFQDRKDMRSLIRNLKLEPEQIEQETKAGTPRQLVRMALKALKLL